MRVWPGQCCDGDSDCIRFIVDWTHAINTFLVGDDGVKAFSLSEKDP